MENHIKYLPTSWNRILQQRLSIRNGVPISPIFFLQITDLQPKIKGDLILHSDQGTQFTSKAFVDFCESVRVTQSMSKAGYPYDNAPMERYFNVLKNECANLWEFQTEESLYQTIEEFAYVEYNYAHPHSFNTYATPHEARVTDNKPNTMCHNTSMSPPGLRFTPVGSEQWSTGSFEPLDGPGCFAPFFMQK